MSRDGGMNEPGAGFPPALLEGGSKVAHVVPLALEHELKSTAETCWSLRSLRHLKSSRTIKKFWFLQMLTFALMTPGCELPFLGEVFPGPRQLKLASDWSQWGANPVLLHHVCMFYSHDVLFQRRWKNTCFLSSGLLLMCKMQICNLHVGP